MTQRRSGSPGLSPALLQAPHFVAFGDALVGAPYGDGPLHQKNQSSWRLASSTSAFRAAHLQSPFANETITTVFWQGYDVRSSTTRMWLRWADWFDHLTSITTWPIALNPPLHAGNRRLRRVTLEELWKSIGLIGVEKMQLVGAATFDDCVRALLRDEWLWQTGPLSREFVRAVLLQQHEQAAADVGERRPGNRRPLGPVEVFVLDLLANGPGRATIQGMGAGGRGGSRLYRLLWANQAVRDRLGLP